MGIRTVQDIANAAYKAGWRGTDLLDAVATAGIESSFNDSAVSPTGCCGAWQMCPCVGNGDLQANANAAYAKWQGAGGTFQKDWWQYDGGKSNPRWKEFFDQAVGTAIGGGSNPILGGPVPPITNPLDAVSNALSGVWTAWQKMLFQVALVGIGVVVVVLGIILLVFQDLKKAAPIVAEAV